MIQVLGLSGIILCMELIGHRDLAKTAGPLDHWTTTTPLALSFREVELAALLGAVAVAAVAIVGGRSSRLRGLLLIAAYAGAVALFYSAGNR